MTNIQYYKTEVGEMVLGAFDGKLCVIDFKNRKKRASVDKRIKKALASDFVERNCDVLESAKAQLDEYLEGSRRSFDLPILMIGSDFQKSVWNALLQIPYGETMSYADLAKNIGRANAHRAVANANGANALGIIIPCHRVVASNGGLGGYAGGLEAKQKLLGLETYSSLN